MTPGQTLDALLLSDVPLSHEEGLIAAWHDELQHQARGLDFHQTRSYERFVDRVWVVGITATRTTLEPIVAAYGRGLPPVKVYWWEDRDACLRALADAYLWHEGHLPC